MDGIFMDERILVDTSVFIDYFRKPDKESSLYARLSASYDISISVITVFELGEGIRNELHQTDFDTAMLQVQRISLDYACILEALSIHKTLRQRNKRIGFPDTLIAATAVTYNLSVATLNTTHFQRVPHLRLLDVSL
jgi:tRNA(fMet)-specific endonuclease VapC